MSSNQQQYTFTLSFCVSWGKKATKCVLVSSFLHDGQFEKKDPPQQFSASPFETN
jgi:hypothetical protein